MAKAQKVVLSPEEKAEAKQKRWAPKNVIFILTHFLSILFIPPISALVTNKLYFFMF